MESQIAQTEDYAVIIPNTQSNITVPLMQNSVPAVSKNQINPDSSEVDNLRAALRSTSHFVSCPYCKYTGMTRTERQCSGKSILCSVISLGILWLPFQACRGKDINCYSATHICSRCANTLADYSAC